jgi:hypothetical protein
VSFSTTNLLKTNKKKNYILKNRNNAAFLSYARRAKRQASWPRRAGIQAVTRSGCGLQGGMSGTSAGAQ